MTTELLGVTKNFALFGDADNLTVTVSLASLDVYDPQPLPSVRLDAWGDPDPALVPTEVFELAESALSSTQHISGTDVIVAAAAADRRSFAIPKSVQEEAQQALRWTAEHHRAATSTSTAVTEVGMNTARTLAKGGSIGINKVRHISRYFEKHPATPATNLSDEAGSPSDTRVSHGLWGGEPAARWSAGIVRRSDSLATKNVLALATADSAPTSQSPPAPAPEAVPDEPPAETETEETLAAEPVESEDVDGLVWDPEEPHPFMPSVDLAELCEVCMANEHAVAHSDDNVGLAASAVKLTPEMALVAALCDIPLASYFVTACDGKISALFSRSRGSWRGWDAKASTWLATPEQADSDVILVDNETAVHAATTLQTGETLPDLLWDPAEAQMFADALPSVPEAASIPLEEVAFATELDPEIEETSGLFVVTDDGVCWLWGGNDYGDWEAQDECPDDTTLVDLEVALEIAAEMAPQLDADDIEEAFNRAAYIAAGNTPEQPIAAAGSNIEEEYTPEERSKNASQQFRDAAGRFAKVGAIVHSNDGRSGEVTGVNPQTNTVRVRFDNGVVQDVDPKSLTKVGQVQPEATPQPADAAKTAKKKEKEKPFTYPKIDYSKIQGQPRAIGKTPKAFLPKLLPPMDKDAIKTVISDYQDFIDKERERKLEKFSAFAELNPDNTDVKPLYLAVVDELDNSAVLDLVALVPGSKGSNQLTGYIRSEGGWKEDPALIRDLQSTSPPALVTLDDETYQTVLQQVDGYFVQQAKEADAKTASGAADFFPALWSEDGTLLPAVLNLDDFNAITAAGVPGTADTPGDVAAARRLKAYWLRGEGAAKIRWGTPGDWKRCRQHLTKYMRDAEGYCQNLHKEATGVYTGDKRNVGGNGRSKRGLAADGSAMFLAVAPKIGSAPKLPGDDAMLVEINLPTVKELAKLSTRDFGHQLLEGEKFLVGAGDGTYVIRVLNRDDISGWAGQTAAIVQPYKKSTTLMVLNTAEIHA